jgi:hypothetical protein
MALGAKRGKATCPSMQQKQHGLRVPLFAPRPEPLLLPSYKKLQLGKWQEESI